MTTIRHSEFRKYEKRSPKWLLVDIMGSIPFLQKMFNTYLLPRRRGEGAICLQVAFPVATFLEMLTKSVNLRATASSRTGCVRHGVGSSNALLKARQQKCCRRPSNQHSPDEH